MADTGAGNGDRRVYFVGLNNVPFLPLVAGLLRSYAEQDPQIAAHYSFADPVFLPDTPQRIADGVVAPDVLGLSCYVWNFRRQMKVAKLVKERYPNVLVVAGGPHVPDRIGTFFADQPWVDVAVHGEGEDAFRELLRERLRPEPDYTRVPGVSVRRAEPAGDALPGSGPVAGPVFLTLSKPGTEPVRLPRDIRTPSPYLLGHMDASVRTCRERGLRFYALWETNRGCPYSCAFCDWGSATMSALRLFDDERITEEIDWFAGNDVEDLFICDANFGILPRDLEIARAIADARGRCGAPRQVRVNFAKNSNDRVFAISQVWHRAELLMGTTLSMQSTDMDVLEAIDRKNIGIDNYSRLQRRYRAAGIPTYTELILGLPLETSRSFREGVGSLLAAGNHDDIRVYEFGILPNAPINTPEKIERYGLRTAPKRLYVEEPGTPADEAETVDMVVETGALSRDDWVDSMVFVQLIQFLHNGCYTRYLSQHLARAHGIGYTEFYSGLLEHFAGQQDTVLGAMTGRMRRLYGDYISIPELPLANLVASQPDMVADLVPYGTRRGWTVDHWGWLRLASHYDRFHAELAGYLAALGLPVGPPASGAANGAANGAEGESDAAVLAEVVRYQRDVMIRPEYDPRPGKTVSYAHDLPAYFRGEPLVANPVHIHYRDTALGAGGRYPIVPGDLKAFAKAAVGQSYPVSRIRHYQHQLEDAEVIPAAEASPALEPVR